MNLFFGEPTCLGSRGGADCRGSAACRGRRSADCRGGAACCGRRGADCRGSAACRGRRGGVYRGSGRRFHGRRNGRELGSCARHTGIEIAGLAALGIDAVRGRTTTKAVDTILLVVNANDAREHQAPISGGANIAISEGKAVYGTGGRPPPSATHIGIKPGSIVDTSDTHGTRHFVVRLRVVSLHAEGIPLPAPLVNTVCRLVVYTVGEGRRSTFQQCWSGEGLSQIAFHVFTTTTDVAGHDAGREQRENGEEGSELHGSELLMAWL